MYALGSTQSSSPFCAACTAGARCRPSALRYAWPAHRHAPAVHGPGHTADCENTADAAHVTRRAALVGLAVVTTGIQGGPAQALPLAPLGGVQQVGTAKRTGLTPEQVADVLRQDLAGSQYFVTGQLTPEVWADDCTFVDPTNSVTGLSKYLKALGLLFDPEWSKVVLLDIHVAGPATIEADWVLGGWLRAQYFPWNAKVEPFKGHTVYTLGSDGLIVRQEQTWSISGFTALQETFTPVRGPRYALDFSQLSV